LSGRSNADILGNHVCLVLGHRSTSVQKLCFSSCG